MKCFCFVLLGLPETKDCMNAQLWDIASRVNPIQFTSSPEHNVRANTPLYFPGASVYSFTWLPTCGLCFGVHTALDRKL